MLAWGRVFFVFLFFFKGNLSLMDFFSRGIKRKSYDVQRFAKTFAFLPLR